MARSAWLAHLAILLMVVTFFTGCVTTGPRDFEDGRAHSTVVDTGHDNGAEKAHGGGGAVAALFVVGAFIIMGAVIADIVILPFTAPHHHAFCCCREVAHCCYH